MKKTHTEFGDFAPRIGSKPATNAGLIIGSVVMIAVCWGVFVIMSLIS